MAAAAVSDVGLEIIRDKISGRKDGFKVGESQDKGEHTRMSWALCCYLPASTFPTAVKQELKKPHPGLVPHKVRQQISNTVWAATVHGRYEHKENVASFIFSLLPV